MAKVQIGRKDLVAGKVVTPDWYKTQIVAYETAPAAKDKSTNHIYTFRGLEGEARDVEKKMYYNEKWMGDAIRLWTALGKKFDEEKEGTEEVDPEGAVDQVLECYWGNETYNKRVQNTIEDYRPARLGK